MPLRNVLWLIAAAVVSLMCYGEAGRNRFAGMLSESIDKISRYYVEPVDRRQLFEGGLRGMLNELDPYSGFISPEEYNQFNIEIRQHFGGIGIEVAMEDDRLTIMNPIPGSPAYDAGLMAGDVIIGIDGDNIEGESIDQVVNLMRGPAGTMVEVEVVHRGEVAPRKYKIERAEIRIESVRGDRRDARGHWSFVLDSHPRIGYIRVLSFGSRTADDLRAALQSIEGQVDGLIMDLRGNAGGLLPTAVELCEMFIPEGKLIVSTRGRDPGLAESFWSENPPQVDPELPVVVMVDRFSASAAEIFAACLQDHHRATIVGERTWGKGTVQNVIELEQGKSAIRLTTQTYWRPSGENIHRHRNDGPEDAWGVKPESDEDTIEFTPDEYRAVYDARRKRDYANGSSKPEAADIESEGEAKRETQSENASPARVESESEPTADSETASEGETPSQPETEHDDAAADRAEDAAAEPAGSDRESPTRSPDLQGETHREAPEHDAAGRETPDTTGPVIDRQLERALEVLQRTSQVAVAPFRPSTVAH